MQVPRGRAPTRLHTARWAEPFLLVLNLIGIHLLLPLLGIVWLARWLGGGPAATTRFDSLRMTALVVAAIFYAYLAVLVNLVETHENMRYRQEVEPFIWLITLISVSELARLMWPRVASGAGLGAPSSRTELRPAVPA